MISGEAARRKRLICARFALVLLGIAMVSGAFATTAVGHLICTGQASEIELLDTAVRPLAMRSSRTNPSVTPRTPRRSLHWPT